MGCLPSKKKTQSVTVQVAPAPGTASEQECLPCGRENCGYYRTWHKTHCCNACADHGTHGPRCDKKVNPAVQALLETQMAAALASAGDPYKSLQDWAGKASSQLAPAGRKLNVLCLHGITMNGDMLKGMAKPLTKDCTDFADFYFPSAPHPIDEKHSFCKKNKMKPGPNAKTWTLEGGKGRGDFAQHLYDFVEKEVPGPVDVLLGYSQGGFSIHQLLGISPAESTRFPEKLHSVRAVVIMMSGGTCKSSTKLRSLHVIGLEDKIVAPHASEKSASHYVDPVIAKFKGVDHSGPFKPQCVVVAKEFLKGVHDFHSAFQKLGDM